MLIFRCFDCKNCWNQNVLAVWMLLGAWFLGQRKLSQDAVLWLSL